MTRCACVVQQGQMLLGGAWQAIAAGLVQSRMRTASSSLTRAFCAFSHLAHMGVPHSASGLIQHLPCITHSLHCLPSLMQLQGNVYSKKTWEDLRRQGLV